MKWILALWLLVGAAQAQTPVPPASAGTPAPVLAGKWNPSKAPWDFWFKENVTVTDKTEYVHFFWNAQDMKGNFEVKDKKRRLADAALQMVSRLTPADAKGDWMKVDIVYVLERDSYGQPKLDSLQQVAHLEFSRAKALKLLGKKSVAEATLLKLFDKFEIF